MVGGGSPPVLRALQQTIIQEIQVSYFNSYDHDTTLTNVAAHRGVCIAPGFLNDHCGAFAWTPFDTEKNIPIKGTREKTYKNSSTSSKRSIAIILTFPFNFFIQAKKPLPPGIASFIITLIKEIMSGERLFRHALKVVVTVT